MTRGKFISIEGIEGAGKTTQVRLLLAAFNAARVDVLSTREPGGSPAADDLREVFLRHEWDGVAETFLLMGGRRDHVTRTILPKLAEGRWVVSDRFALTTYAYQGHGRGVDRNLLKVMNEFSTDGLVPDLPIILDVPAEVGLERAHARSTLDRMERLSVEFFERVRAGFLEQAKLYPIEPVVVDATGTREEVHRRICAVVSERLNVEVKPWLT